MPSSFPVTATSNIVVLDASRKGTASLTVTNAAGRPVRVRMTPAVSGSTGASWIMVDGGGERDLPIGSAQEVKVTVQVPPEVAAGDYVFRVDVVAEDKPEEDFAHGPDLTIKVPAATTKPKPFPWWIIAVIVAVLLIGGGIIYAFASKGGGSKSTPTTTTSSTSTTLTHFIVPNVIGQSLSAATMVLQGDHFMTAYVEAGAASTNCNELVTSMNPAAGSTAAVGSLVVMAVQPIPFRCIIVRTFPGGVLHFLGTTTTTQP